MSFFKKKNKPSKFEVAVVQGEGGAGPGHRSVGFAKTGEGRSEKRGVRIQGGAGV